MQRFLRSDGLCDSDDPKASAKACEKVLANFAKKTDSPMPCVEFCGNGITEGTEACDDGFTTSCGTCNDTCSGAGTGSACGDGILCPDTEVCDDGFTTSCGTCNETCSGAGTGSACGDGILCPDTEACDDGNTDPGDGCDASCVDEMTLTILCTGDSPDGTLDTSEECDDGNNINYDACTNACTLPACGDGIISHGAQSGVECNVHAGDICRGGAYFFLYDNMESCDDLNTDDGDGCSATCRREYCGDGVFQPAVEACDWSVPICGLTFSIPGSECVTPSIPHPDEDRDLNVRELTAWTSACTVDCHIMDGSTADFCAGALDPWDFSCSAGGIRCTDIWQEQRFVGYGPECNCFSGSDDAFPCVFHGDGGDGSGIECGQFGFCSGVCQFAGCGVQGECCNCNAVCACAPGFGTVSGLGGCARLVV